jgi:hypothetical protein
MRRPTSILTIAAVLLPGLAGCVAAPGYGYPGYAAPSGYYAPPPDYAPGPVYVAPAAPWYGGGYYHGRPDGEHEGRQYYGHGPDYHGSPPPPHGQPRPPERGAPPPQRGPGQGHEHERGQGDPR